jgi:hypothetical protein
MPIETILINALALPMGKFLLKKYFASPLDDIGGSLLTLAGKEIVDRKTKKESADEFERLSRAAVNRLLPLFNDYEGRRDVNVETVIHEIATTLDGKIDAKFFLEKDLDAKELEAELKKQRPLPTYIESVNVELYNRGLKGIVQALLDVANKLPHFEAKYAAKSLAQLKKIIVSVEAIKVDVQEIKDSTARIEKKLSGEDEKAGYETEYRKAVKANLDHMELFGADLKPNQKKHKLLSVAYVSLNLQEQDKAGSETLYAVEDFLDTLQPGKERLLIQGDAGSGKSTLFRWIAINAAEGTQIYHTIGKPFHYTSDNPEETSIKVLEGGAEAYWRQRVPFLLRLRDCENGLLPTPDEFPTKISTAIGEPPVQWVKSVLDAKRGLILLDGIDEIPHQHRDALRTSVEDYLARYEGNYFLMSARPAAIRDWEEWFNSLSFRSAAINPMTENDKAALIKRWHEAVAQTLQEAGEDSSDLKEYGDELIEKLKTLPTVSQLAVYPLLCAMICALHYWRDKELPRSYWDLCEDLCAMMLHKRDKESKVRVEEFPPSYAQLDYGHKRRLIQRVAMQMVQPEVVSSIEHDVVLNLAREMLARVPQRKAEEANELVECLIERSGILREPTVGTVDFIHNTFKEFLAADWLVSEKKTDVLLENATNPDWEKIILFAAGANNESIASQLISRLLEAGGHAKHLLAIRCRAMARYLDEALEPELDRVEKSLFPPRKMGDAEALATLGNPVVNYLKYNRKYRVGEAAACIRTLRLIGTDEAMEALKEYFDDTRSSLVPELALVTNPLSLPSVKESFLQTGYVNPSIARNITDLSHVNDPSSLSRLNEFQELDFSYWRMLSGIEPLSALKNLRILDLSHTSVYDLSALTDLSNLQGLYLNHTAVSDINPLSTLKNLQSLGLDFTDVSDIEPLRALINLENLSIGGPNVRDINSLRALINLKSLDLGWSNVSDITPLSNLIHLESLDLTLTDVTDVSPLASAVNLRYLHLFQSHVKDISALRHLPNFHNFGLDDDI